AEAKGPAGISNTIHNLSASAPTIPPMPGPHQYWSDEDEVCIFCHTPHGGVLNGPLWNRPDPAPAQWTHYTSATLSTYLQGLATDRAPSDESLLCLSCHDGSVSVYSLHNYSNDLPVISNQHNFQTDTTIVDGMPGRIGSGPLDSTGDMSDDHPVSFSYLSVLSSAEYLPGGQKENSLRSVAAATTWSGEGIRFIGVTYRVECTSCHDPHVDYMNNAQYTPFLIMPNTGSNLCMACHNK
ncbi:hypothetical protein EG829_33835, partial [bacterium]|nr:hypothetical protein [bacterium]